MSKLEELIEQYCPDGVEWKMLGEVCDIHKGVQFNKTDMKEVGTYPVINGGINPSGYAEVFNEEKNTITISQGGASAGYVNFLRNKFWLGAHCYAVIPYDTVLNKYLYHFIKMNEITLQQCQYGAGIPALAKSTISSLEIPVPPLPVQEEIVRILDNFTELQAELQAELQKRKQQYNYYLDNLLSFNRGGQTEVKWMKMSDIAKLSRGHVISKDYLQNNAGIYPVYSSQTANNGELGQINTYDYNGNYLTWTTDGAYAGTIFKRKGCFSITNVCGLIALTSELVNLDYLYYWLKITAPSYVYKGMGNPKLMSNVMESILIPIIPLSEQQRIVAILDRFDTLTNDLTAGLPAEIEKRRQQYEYYRDKLLTFKRKGA